MMRVKFPHALRILSWLILASTGFVCQRFQQKSFIISNAWRNYCPGLAGAYQTPPVKSITECAVMCSLASPCVAFGFYSSSVTCFIYAFVPQRVYYDDDCILMMDRDALSSSSELSATPFESFCNVTQIDYRDCLTLTLVTKTKENVTICLTLPGLSEKSELDVDLGEGPVLLPIVNNWIVLMNRFNGSLNFKRTWTEYTNGFGEIGRGEFWLGNEKVHRLTNRTGQTYSLRIEVMLSTTGEWLNADYSTFSLDSEDNKYAIHLSGFCGRASNSLTNTTVPSKWNHNGNNFSTWDSDNDQVSPNNCAEQYDAGWWFNNCWLSCLTCPYNSWTFAWLSLKSSQADGKLRAARIMFRSR